MALESRSYVIRDPSGGNRLHISTKRYRFVGHPSDQPGVILLLLHGAGFHKEIWEPLLEELRTLQSGTGRNIVKEAWAVDSPNCGEAAVINDEILFHTPLDPNDVTLQDFARAGLRVLLSGHIVTVAGDRIVAVGHSVGAAAAAWTSYLYHNEHQRRVDLCVMIEPPGEVLGKTPIKAQKSVGYLDATVTRRDIWASKEEAHAWLAKRPPWKVWDKRVLRTYVDFGLRSLPTSGYPDRAVGVTLSCHRLHEGFAYIDLPELNVVARRIPLLCQISPIHVFVGERSFLRPTKEVFAAIVRGTAPGISISEIPRGDHLVVHEIPKELAALLHTFLGDFSFGDQRSRL